MKKLLLILLMAGAASADPAPNTLALQTGIGTDSAPMLGLAWSGPLPWHDLLIYEIAGGSHNTGDASMFLAGGVGLEVRMQSHLYFRGLTGLAVNTNSDENMDGHLQFRTLAGLGYWGEVGRVGLFYQLLSNGGISDGYSHVGLEVGVSF